MAEKINLELEVEAKDAEKEVNSIVNAINKLGNDLAENNKKIEEGLESIKKTSEETSGGIKGMGLAIKTAGVGLFLSALETLKELFMQNQMVVDVTASAFEGLALVFNDVFGLLTGGLDSVKKIGDAFDKYFGKPIETAVKSFEKFGDAFSKIFGGDFSGALDDINLGMTGLQAAISQTGDGFTEAANDAVDYTKQITAAAISNVELAKEAQRAEIINAGLLEKYDRAAEQQRQIRDEERNSIEERIKANEELGRLLEEQNKVMLDNAKTVEAAAQAAFDRNNSLENEIALIAAKNEVMAVEATVEGFRSEQLANELALDKEKIELTNTKLESETNLSLERKKFNAEQEANNVTRLQKLIEINETEKGIQEERLQRIVDEANVGTQAKVDAQIALDEFTEANRQENVTLTKEYNEAIALSDKESSDEIIANAKLVEEANAAKLNALIGGLGTLKGMAEGNLKLQKALIIAESAASIGQIIMNTNKANAIATGGAPFSAGLPWTAINTANAAIGIASTISSSKKALSAIGKGGSVASDVSLPPVSSAPQEELESVAPQFNIVGQSGANRMADVFASQKPVKAYVVANDVTTAQSLERNIVEGATLGG